MEINLEELFIEQDKLNKVIFEKHNITSYNEVLNELVLALYVEIGELANEIRSFKYWSIKPSSSEETILDEYADCVHFIISLCLAFNENNDFNINDGIIKINDKKEITSYLKKLFSTLDNAISTKKMSSWFSDFIDFGYLLGFDIEKIKKAYFKKHDVNIERQKTNY